ncbi:MULTISPECIES: DMT family transporter [Shewanella]|uniref:DMT family transporter n=1 Tax=Shewanella TaxID=22 RepID=UPI000DEA23C9|nr:MULTISPECIES: DMT family transporter [Shewanella]MBW3531379.1 DMT family transporter [Shewanella sp. NKUCC06_TVS]RBP76602.1 EamA-like transporter family protein [Shewanella putrefaciens]MCU7961291.1 DMT family transporter [Shewanella sp. SW32]MCU7969373.1 DMT family transporter [Shewanella sp. SW29]MCU8023989.1 DMT family transporter [Shewanella sp. SM78]
MKSSNLAYVYGMAAVFLWSTVATAFKIALSYYTPLQLVFVAVLTSIIALAGILAWQKKLSLLKQQFLRRPMFYLVTGLINPFLYYVVLFKAYSLLPAQQALSLNYTWAVLLPLLAAPLLKQHLRKSDIAAALIAYTGVFIIATGGDISGFSFDSPLGIGLALTSTLLWCLYWIVNTKDQGDPVVSLLLSFLIGLPFIAVTLVLTDTLPSFSLKAIFAGMYVGLFEMGITFVLWLMALKTATRTANISTMVFLSPVMSIGFIAWILQETIAMATYLGLAFILSGMMLQQLLPRYLERKNKISTKLAE